eukprot:206239_1
MVFLWYFHIMPFCPFIPKTKPSAPFESAACFHSTLFGQSITVGSPWHLFAIFEGDMHTYKIEQILNKKRSSEFAIETANARIQTEYKEMQINKYYHAVLSTMAAIKNGHETATKEREMTEEESSVLVCKQAGSMEGSHVIGATIVCWI